jgi:hypothetical protein
LLAPCGVRVKAASARQETRSIAKVTALLNA